ncbi:MAG TPA: SDR family NAD(P)-dependent oxidoreductase [Bacteroidota bacterium]|nr:SDR family NAD(P)-dependent oxidoreductase [Bacteroidota bacterium]
MTSLKNKVVFITGASSGIGAACAVRFAKEGASLLLAARRIERLDVFAEGLGKNHGVKVKTLHLDVRRRSDVEHSLAALPEAWQQISVLVNNAGLASGFAAIQEGDVDDWEKMIDTNIKGLLYVTRSVVPGMIRRGEGHIINIGSIAGDQFYPKGNVYCATKAAVAALTSTLRLDLNGSGVRVSTVNPGLVETEFSIVRFHGDKGRADKTYDGMTPLTGDDIADAVVYCATRPPHVNIQEVVLTPTDQASTTIVHRRQSSGA